MGKDLNRQIIEMILDGRIKSRDQLQKTKVKLAGRYKLDAVTPNSEILADATVEERKIVGPFLIRKPVRTISGVAVVAVMTSPHPCPHGKCIYCPGGVESGSPQSYTGKEPAARRGARNDFDPFRQVEDRINQLESIGHKTDKIDLIIMGGTFTSRDEEYQTWFVKRCFDAMNGKDADDIETAQVWNSVSGHRCVGMTVETRPDVFNEEQITRSMMLGATRVELGVQILDEDILKAVNRGHGVKEIKESTKKCKDHGLKICYHIMPGLPGSSPEKDLSAFRTIFDDDDFRPDMLKFYTTLVIEGTQLYDMWKDGAFMPYDVETGVDVVSKMKTMVPEYVRIQRIQRDIPVPQIAAGITKSNLRELVQEHMALIGTKCRCIRCREVGQNDVSLDDPDKICVKDISYTSSGGEEHFISLEYEDSLIGYVRLRTDQTDTAMIRELKVFGKMAAIGEKGEEWQHKGFGKSLLQRAEDTARKAGKIKVRITSGVGVRKYYESLGYSLERPYMVRIL